MENYFFKINYQPNNLIELETFIQEIVFNLILNMILGLIFMENHLQSKSLFKNFY
jgi:hypothetical protein